MRLRIINASTVSILVLMMGTVAQRAMGDTVLTDGTFNLSNYTVTQYTQTGTISAQQITSGGNPGDALAVIFSTPSTPPFTTDQSEIYFVNNISYTLSSSVALSFSIDKELSSASSLPAGFVVANGQNFILSQNGNLYQYGVPLSGTLGTFMTASTGTLTASNFGLITNASVDATDPTMHSNFSAGPIMFGFKDGLGVPANTGNVQLEPSTTTSMSIRNQSETALGCLLILAHRSRDHDAPFFTRFWRTGLTASRDGQAERCPP